MSLQQQQPLPFAINSQHAIFFSAAGAGEPFDAGAGADWVATLTAIMVDKIITCLLAFYGHRTRELLRQQVVSWLACFRKRTNSRQLQCLAGACPLPAIPVIRHAV
jgi:hypothetical protein